jgi:hypothetical protein
VAKRITKGNLWGYIQSRPYSAVSDIRRLFTMDVDGAATIPSNEGTCYIGLPQDAADIVGQLWQEGRIALDLNPNVKARVVQGVYPARAPVLRHGSGQGSGRSATAVHGQPPGAAEEGGRKRRRRRKRAAGEAAGADPGGA